MQSFSWKDGDKLITNSLYLFNLTFVSKEEILMWIWFCDRNELIKEPSVMIDDGADYQGEELDSYAS